MSNKKKKRKLRRGVVIFIIVLICLVPAVIVGGIIKNLTSDEISAGQLISVTLKYDGKEKTLDKDADIDEIAQIVTTAARITDPARDIKEYAEMSVTFRKMFAEIGYTFFLSDSADDCLIRNAQGEFFRIAKPQALMLLTKDEMGFIYENATLPAYSFTCGESSLNVICTSCEWFYRIADGEYRKSVVDNPSAYELSSTAVVTESRKIGVTFDVPPDWQHIKLYGESGDVAFDGTVEEFAEHGISADREYRAELSAQWYEDPTGAKKYHGSAKFVFDVFCDREAKCTVSASSAYPGELIILKIENGMNETFTVKTDIITSNKIEFFELDGVKAAFLPVSCDNAMGTKTVSVTGDRGFSEKIKITVAEKEFNSLSLDTANLGCTPSQYISANASLKGKLEQLDKTKADEKLWDGKFAYPTSDRETWIDTRFGAVWTVLGSNAKIRCPGIIYAGNSSGTNICASNNGKVIYAGSYDLAGNMVVIDHGLGVKSIYYHLGSVTVSVGDTVFKGQTLGKLGSTGYIGKNRYLVAFSVNGVFINPYFFCSSGITL